MPVTQLTGLSFLLRFGAAVNHVMDPDLSGTVFAVTGASSGIGLAISRLLSGAGADLICVDRQLPADTAIFASVIQADLTDPEDFARIADKLPARLDGLLNVAGVPGTAPVRTQLLVNVTASKRMAEICAPRIERGGSITNIASLAGSGWRSRADEVRAFLALPSVEDQVVWLGQHGIAGPGAYPFTKECVVVLSALLAVDLIPQGIRVNSISPGPVETPLLADFRQTIGDEVIDGAQQVLGRLAAPEDIAAVAAFVASGRAVWLNGIDIPVDGGLGAYRFASSTAIRSR